MKKLMLVFLCLAMIGLLAACGGPSPDANSDPSNAESNESSGANNASDGDVLKVALCVTGSINDGGWCASAYEGLMKAEEELGVEVSYTENVEVADMEAVFTDYANQGYGLIIGHGFQFGDPALAVGAKYPDVKFACIASTVSSDNVASYDTKGEDGGYIMGMLAAGMSESGKIGIVSGMEGPSLIKFNEAFKVGAREINPDVEIAQAYTGSFTDVAAAKEAALAMIENGADVIGHSANEGSLGVIKAAEENGVLVTGESVDQNYLAPDTVICCPIYHMPDLIYLAITDVQNGTFKGEVRELGLKAGVIEIGPYHGFEDKIPEELKEKVADKIAAIMDGSFEAPRIEEITND